MRFLSEGRNSHVFVDGQTTQISKVYKTEEGIEFPRIDALSEMVFMREFDHPNIPKLLDFVIYQDLEKRHFMAIMEYGGVELTKDIIKTLTDDQINEILLQYFSAVKYIHDRDILHCDIKLDNILIHQETLRINLIDFGLSIVLQSPRQLIDTSRMYAYDYKAPELLENESIQPEKSCDIYASGMVLLFLGLVDGRSPLLSRNPEERPKVDEILTNLREVGWRRSDVIHAIPL